MIVGNKIFCHLDNGKKPVTADIFLTDYCNNACPYCNYGRYVERKGEYMPYERFIEYADRMWNDLGVEGFILTGGGEPTLNPDFDKITTFLERAEVPYGINTNFNIYKDCEPTFLKVSLDGYDRDSYKRRRGVDAFAETIENIKRFRKEHVATNLGIQMMATNLKDVEQFYFKNRELDFDYMVFRPVESCGGEYYKDFLKYQEQRNIVSFVKKLASLDSRVVLNYKFGFIGENASDCPAHWSQLCLNPRGEVMYCCHKPNQIVGHIMDEDIILKHNLATFNHEDCDTPCRLSGPNAALRGLKEIDERMFI